MNSTVAVAALGFLATLAGSWLTAHLQHRSDRDGRILEARLRVYGDCSETLFEYSRATYDRVKSRLQGMPEADRDIRRQEAYRCNAGARSAIGQAYILSGNRALEENLSQIRREIGELNKLEDLAALKHRQDEVYEQLKKTLDTLRENLIPPPSWRRRLTPS